MILYRHTDNRHPFLWETAGQPPARWHGPGEGPTHYFSDTPDGAWAEFLRHEGIRTALDLVGVTRALWAVEIPGDAPGQDPGLPDRTLRGPPSSYPACRREARRLREEGCRKIIAPSAALKQGAACGWRVEGGIKPGPKRDGKVVVLFGRRPDLVGWPAAGSGRPDRTLLAKVRHFPRKI